MTEIAIHEPVSNGTLALRSDQDTWTPTQMAALAQLGVQNAPAGDLDVFLHVAQRTGLDPFSRQIYMIARWDPQTSRNKWTIQTGIDGFRIIADRRPEYRGQVGPEWCGPDGAWTDVWVSDKPPVAARVGVLRSDFDKPIYGTALYREYRQTKKGGEVTAMWRDKAALMIAKCAEALALRRAFPHDLGGLHTDEEMAHLDQPAHRGRVVLEHDAQPVTAAELTGRPEPAAWDDTRWRAEVDAAYAAHDDGRVNELWNRASKERPDDAALRDAFAAAASRHGNRRTRPEDVVDVDMVDEPEHDGADS